MKRKGQKKKKTPWVTYNRCFALTLGLISLPLGIILLVNPVKTDVKIGGVLITLLGAYLFWVAFFGSKSKLNTVYNASTNSWESIIVMIIAFPLYTVLSAFERISPND